MRASSRRWRHYQRVTIEMALLVIKQIIKYEILKRNEWGGQLKMLDNLISNLEICAIMLLYDFLQVYLILDIIKSCLLEDDV